MARTLELSQIITLKEEITSDATQNSEIKTEIKNEFYFEEVKPPSEDQEEQLEQVDEVIIEPLYTLDFISN